MLDNSGLSGPPCGVPSSFDTTIPLIIIPDCRYFLINFKTLLSLMSFDNLYIKIS